MATFVKLHPFVEAVAEKKHDLGSDQITLFLTNTVPSVTDAVLTDLTEISYTNLSSRDITTTSSVQTSGTYKLILADITVTASGGTVGPFRYVGVYNNTATNDDLIGYYDRGSSLTLEDTDTFTTDFDGSGGFITLA